MTQKWYIAIDLKSFYASVECVERGLDPMTTNLVVADKSRTDKTICLAVSPSLKSFGIPGRPRLFEVIQRVRQVNAERTASAGSLRGASSDYRQLERDPRLAVDYIVAPPRMAYYMEYSSRVYEVYLKYIAPEDIHVYSVDEVFIDVTAYLKTYGLTPRELAMKMILDVLATTGITATAGVGTNMYLAKVAMDIVAKHIPADENGVRIAELDEMSYRRELWDHRPITDFWRVGNGYKRRLESAGIYTMGDVALCSVGRGTRSEEWLYKTFGVNAELLIDHAWGVEPCTIADVKAYRPATSSLSSGQVLKEPYTAQKAKLIVREMTDLLVLELVEKHLCTDRMVLTVGYDVENLKDPEIRSDYAEDLVTDRYGREIPKSAHGTGNIGRYTSSTKEIMEVVSELYDRIVDPRLLVRRITLAACCLVDEKTAEQKNPPEQLDIFSILNADDAAEAREEAERDRERAIQTTVIDIKRRYGKNAIIRGMNLEEGATAKERNAQIGGHKA